MNTSTLQTCWLASLDIPAVLRRVLNVRPDITYAQESMIDSTPRVGDLPSLVPLLKRRGVGHTRVDGDVVLDSSALLALVDEDQLLTGFDEIWLYAGVPKLSKPESLRITSDTPLDGDPPAGLADWMCISTCVAGLGDGDGLNFATFDRVLIEDLVAADAAAD